MSNHTIHVSVSIIDDNGTFDLELDTMSFHYDPDPGNNLRDFIHEMIGKIYHNFGNGNNYADQLEHAHDAMVSISVAD